ncbi:sulfotransferase family protein [Campylobacter concisus]|uniref:sulfotransferase domain-containing protein n=1 Tax=Campylobacter concisus TaxID=199 RepID=UPI001883D4C8|nr:sulfotransferase domain-containing protein [Campylobacter concisus]MBE9829811.1 sulfotransferase family protein [Campylobacter concisus]
MHKQIITSTGYGGTGSSAITDLLKEFDSGISMGDAEFWFLQDYDGVSDLEYYLIDGNHRSKVSMAISKFIKYIKIHNTFYNKFFGENFIKYSNEYINSLVDASFRKALSDYEVSNSFLKLWYFKLYPIMQLGIKKILKQDTFEFSPKIRLIDKYYSIPDKNRFYIETKKYTSKLFSLLDTDNKYKFIAIDQLVPSINTNRYFNYVDNLKVIVVDRDPRDLFLLNETHWNGASYICDTTNIYEYINWYKTMREHRKTEKKNNNVVYMMIEELIYEYDKSLGRLYNFLGLAEEEHIKKRQYFNPAVSKNWTRLWEKYPKYKKEVEIIREHLNEYCYK